MILCPGQRFTVASSPWMGTERWVSYWSSQRAELGSLVHEGGPIVFCRILVNLTEVTFYPEQQSDFLLSFVF